MQGTCTAEYCVIIIEERLKNFNQNIKDDIIGITTDGASLMAKVGRLMPCYQQLCYAYGIPLAVIDVLFLHRRNSEQESLKETQIQLNMPDDEDDDVKHDEGGLLVTSSLPFVEVVSNYRDLTAKVRTIVKVLKNVEKNIYLQKYVPEEHPNLELILDCMTRWNSLL